MALFLAVCIITDKNMKVPSGLQPFIIGLSIVAIADSFVLQSGAILNPARDLGPRIFTAFAGWGLHVFEPCNGNYWWAAGVIGPICGATGICVTSLRNESTRNSSFSSITTAAVWIYWLTIEVKPFGQC